MNKNELYRLTAFVMREQGLAATYVEEYLPAGGGAPVPAIFTSYDGFALVGYTMASIHGHVRHLVPKQMDILDEGIMLY